MTTHVTTYAFPNTPEALDAIITEARSRMGTGQPGDGARQDQQLADLAAAVGRLGVDLEDAVQRHAFLVGAVGGWISSAENCQQVCVSASIGLRIIGRSWMWAVARIARRP